MILERVSRVAESFWRFKPSRPQQGSCAVHTLFGVDLYHVVQVDPPPPPPSDSPAPGPGPEPEPDLPVGPLPSPPPDDSVNVASIAGGVAAAVVLALVVVAFILFRVKKKKSAPMDKDVGQAIGAVRRPPSRHFWMLHSSGLAGRCSSCHFLRSTAAFGCTCCACAVM